MAIDTETARLLLVEARKGACFKDTLMLGRQNYALTDSESHKLLREFGIEASAHPKLFAGQPGNRYAEPFFEVLGARDPQSMDATSYEGARIVHDLNQPIPPALVGRFDVVFDGGTLEHVFHFQTALRNAMQLARVGGKVILHTPANNYFGHGFYQFSPELFFRVFTRDNGYEIERMLAMEYGPRRRWYEVRDPEQIGDRTPLVNAFPVLLYVQARRIAEVPIFERTPQQSDYRSLWQQELRGKAPTTPQSTQSDSLKHRAIRWLKETTPDWLRGLETLANSGLNRALTLRNTRRFKCVDKKRLI